VWNVRGPSAQPESGQARSYKPKAKSRRAQRQSEGIGVLDGGAQAPSTMAVRQNAAGGEGPCGGHADGAGKREGMAGQTGPNDPVDPNNSCQTENRVMLRVDRPLVSRVREIRTHGLEGGVGSELGLRAH